MNDGPLFSDRIFCNDFILKTMHGLKYNATGILFYKNGDRCLDVGDHRSENVRNYWNFYTLGIFIVTSRIAIEKLINQLINMIHGINV